mmetsp:Transcript_2277/g.8221  ORF Transcript_2277/g.8221 Transcript_2277/m.8221 type:complete len:220 (-) Transcript_2277:6401-7060(-)
MCRGRCSSTGRVVEGVVQRMEARGAPHVARKVLQPPRASLERLEHTIVKHSNWAEKVFQDRDACLQPHRLPRPRRPGLQIPPVPVRPHLEGRPHSNLDHRRVRPLLLALAVPLVEHEVLLLVHHAANRVLPGPVGAQAQPVPVHLHLRNPQEGRVGMVATLGVRRAAGVAVDPVVLVVGASLSVHPAHNDLVTLVLAVTGVLTIRVVEAAAVAHVRATA